MICFFILHIILSFRSVSQNLSSISLLKLSQVFKLHDSLDSQSERYLITVVHFALWSQRRHPEEFQSWGLGLCGCLATTLLLKSGQRQHCFTTLVEIIAKKKTNKKWKLRSTKSQMKKHSDFVKSASKISPILNLWWYWSV